MVQAGCSDGTAGRLAAPGNIAPAAALTVADRRLAAAGSVLQRQVTLGPSGLLDDRTVAHVRALAGDLAQQLVPDRPALAEPVRALLVANRAILLHLHALVIESHLAALLAQRRALDPLVPPLLRRRLDADVAGDEAAGLAAALLGCQARQGEALRRMRLPLSELPGDLHHLAMAVAEAARADHTPGETPPRPPPRDEHTGRLGLLRRVLDGLGDDVAMALRIDEAGVALFFSALALASRTPREMVALATAEDDAIRLALLLRAAGLSCADAAAQLLAICPQADPALVALAHDAPHAEHLLAGDTR